MSVTLSNLTISRVSAGSSGAVPPSGDPYWSSVSLLTETTSVNGATNNTFLDSSANNFTITNLNTTQGTFSPFSNIGYSGYFGGSGYLTSASNSAFGLGTGDFTIELWAYPTVNPANGPGTFIDFRTGISASATSLRVDNSRYLHFYNGPANVDTIFTLATVTMSAWNHIAYVRSSNVVSAYINGVLAGSVAVTSDLGTSQPVVIGANQSPGYNFNGYMSNFRIIKGTAIYTGNFTPPTSPVTAITGTSLLLNFANAGIYDAAAKNNMFTAGNTQVSTAQAKFGTTSMKFNGTSDYVNLPNVSSVQLSSSDFTVEGWIYPTSSNQTTIIALNAAASGSSYAALQVNMTLGRLDVYVATQDGAWAGSALGGYPIINSWNFLSIVRSGSQILSFLNGIQVASYSGISGALLNGTINDIGAVYYPAAGFPGGRYGFFNGYMQDMRITKGVARYTANFTPPTAAFPTN